MKAWKKQNKINKKRNETRRKWWLRGGLLACLAAALWKERVTFPLCSFQSGSTVQYSSTVQCPSSLIFTWCTKKNNKASNEPGEALHFCDFVFFFVCGGGGGVNEENHHGCAVNGYGADSGGVCKQRYVARRWFVLCCCFAYSLLRVPPVCFDFDWYFLLYFVSKLGGRRVFLASKEKSTRVAYRCPFAATSI